MNDTWSTRVEVVSDRDGVARFRGFKGRYALEADVGSGSLNGRAAFLENGDRFELNPSPR